MKRYKSDNFPVLHNANIRGEYFYQVRLYIERALFVSAESGILRMQVLLGLLEARVTVIDAVIKTDGNLHYLSIICSSAACPPVFSQLVRRTVPRAIIEEIDRYHAQDCLSSGAVHDEVFSSIPFARTIRTVHDSRKLLLSLLLEYRALLSDFNTAFPGEVSRQRDSPSLESSLPFLIFEQDGTICGIPEFQIEAISPGGNGSHILQLHRTYGSRVVVCNDLLCSKEIDVVDCTFKNKKSSGYYQISTMTTGGNFDFTLVIPAFL